MALQRESGVTQERVPPQSVELEMCVLGGIMLEPEEAYSVAADYLNRDSFYLDGHGIIFELMGARHPAGCQRRGGRASQPQPDRQGGGQRRCDGDDQLRAHGGER